MSSNRKTLREYKREARTRLQKSQETSQVIDIYEKSTSSKTLIKKPTGLVYDEIFTEHECPWDDEYPERPERYSCIFQRVTEYGLVKRCKKVEPRDVTIDEILSKHTQEHLAILKETESKNDSHLETLASQYDAVYFNKKTYASAKKAAGSGINLVTAILEGKLQNGMALIRPPGHHAMQQEFCGYCFFNNVAVAAQHSIDRYNLKRILIVDWDVHHGQATQQMFYDDPRVLYFSIHRYEYGKFWPCLRESNFDYIGKNRGIGFNVNVPLNETGCGDADYLYIVNNLLLPLAYEFQPELVLISAGYDAAIGCPEGRMCVTPTCYASMTSNLMSLAQGKVAVFLEGGYFIPSLAESAALTLGALLGDLTPSVFDSLKEPKESVRKSVSNVIHVLSGHWKCLKSYSKQEDPSLNLARYEQGEDLKAPFPTRDCYLKNTRTEVMFYTAQMECMKIGRERYRAYMRSRVGYCYDPIMEKHISEKANSYETPQRLITAIKVLTDFGLLNRMRHVKCTPASEILLRDVHDKEYLEKLRAMKASTEKELFTKENWVTVFLCDDSMKSALYAAGCVIQLVNDIVDCSLSSGVAVIRPPGHHAEHECAGGFCLLNNVAVGARHAVLNRKLQRVMILDWDVHHGNGTQGIFINDPQVLYLSLHRYDNGSFYPSCKSANFDVIGEHPGEGYNINIAWNNDRMGDAEYMAAFFKIVLPVAYEFQPELLFISAGFDAAVGDPLGGYKVTPEAFGHFVQLLKPTCGGKILLALEGGYNCNSVAYSLAMCSKALLGDPLPHLNNLGRPCQKALVSINNTIKAHEKKWKNLQS